MKEQPGEAFGGAEGCCAAGLGRPRSLRPRLPPKWAPAEMHAGDDDQRIALESEVERVGEALEQNAPGAAVDHMVGLRVGVVRRLINACAPSAGLRREKSPIYETFLPTNVREMR
jgi:hypothetical protein